MVRHTNVTILQQAPILVSHGAGLDRNPYGTHLMHGDVVLTYLSNVVIPTLGSHS